MVLSLTSELASQSARGMKDCGRVEVALPLRYVAQRSGDNNMGEKDAFSSKSPRGRHHYLSVRLNRANGLRRRQDEASEYLQGMQPVHGRHAQLLHNHGIEPRFDSG